MGGDGKMTSGIEDDGDDAGDDKNRIKLYLSKIVYGFRWTFSSHTDRNRVHAKFWCGREMLEYTITARAGEEGADEHMQAKGESSYNDRFPW